MTLKIRLLMLLIALFALTLVSAAQDENTGESPEDNACYAGGSLEGKCDWPTDAEDEWAWTCGWYIARIERAVIPEHNIPKMCNYPTTSVCYDSTVSGEPDLLVIAVPDRANNATLYFSEDGTCSGLLATVTVVTAPPDFLILPIVSEKCAAITGNPEAGAVPFGWLGVYLGLPANYWVCIAP